MKDRWICPQHIPIRHSEKEVEAMMDKLQMAIALCKKNFLYC
ncbi:MAG: hypothetical protein VKN72_07050 [Nostocales cyanobacterium 94392]|nr:hypothetical protein [Nostocales cyanobacterium 94392]